MTYLAFFAPGMLAAASMQNGIIESAFPVRRRRDAAAGPTAVAAATPLEPRDILDGHVLFMAVRIAIERGGLRRGDGGLRRRAVAVARCSPLPAATLTGLAFATPVAAWAVTVDQSDARSARCSSGW